MCAPGWASRFTSARPDESDDNAKTPKQVELSVSINDHSLRREGARLDISPHGRTGRGESAHRCGIPQTGTHPVTGTPRSQVGQEVYLTAALHHGRSQRHAASAAGRQDHPQWYRNLLANPDTYIEIGADRRAVTAVEAGPKERTRLWPRLVEAYADFDSYQSWTDREIPVITLRPRQHRSTTRNSG
jgi:deazaflavin-dependent oxidoreductase (nitroreductase family)